MEQRVMGAATAIILCITIFLCFLLIHFPNIHMMALEFQGTMTWSFGRQSVYEEVVSTEEDSEQINLSASADVLKGHQIRMKLPSDVTSKSVKIENDYLNKLVTITIKGLGKNYFSDYPVNGNCTNIVDITYESDQSVGIIQIALDDVFEVSMVSEEEYIYFDFVDPHDIYDYVVVVDVGHGGSVPGANKMGVSEKNINLDIGLELKKLFDRTDKNIGVYYTRTTDVNPSFTSRVALPNDSEADLFISIHNNSTASGRMSSISGTEVMYRGADSTGESKAFATLCLDKLLNELGSKNKGTVVGDDIYVIRETKMPAVLVEVGFMTNVKELENLKDEEYQKKTARAIYDATIEYLYNK